MCGGVCSRAGLKSRSSTLAALKVCMVSASYCHITWKAEYSPRPSKWADVHVQPGRGRHESTIDWIPLDPTKPGFSTKPFPVLHFWPPSS